MIYQNHIIGILPARVASGSTHDDLPAMQAMAVVFNGEPMKQKMEEFGLPLPSEPLVSGLLR